ncbi:MAG: glycosyltransferase family 2 protein [Chitinophagaceae bacterium]|nr:glycosyltransferase family 2 protein [Chitinophagaceae bacterium]
MKICGFSIVRNAVKFDYPVLESIQSILPLVDHFIVSVGKSDDNTMELIQTIHSSKITIVESEWDESLKTGGAVLARETDKALALIPPEFDWAFYLQADEVVHENDLPKIEKAARNYLHHREVEGLLFQYLHFYATYDYIGDSRRWYRHEIRIIRNNGNIRSYRDAQGFRTKQNRKLKVKKTEASIYHYGWVRHPRKQKEKLENFYTFWNGPEYKPPTLQPDDFFDFYGDVDAVKKFEGTHPAVMNERIKNQNWSIHFDTSKKNLSFKDKLLYRIEKITGRRPFEYRNYRII